MSGDDTSETVLKAAIKRGMSGKDALALADDVGRERAKTPLARFKRWLINALVDNAKKAIVLLLTFSITALTAYLTYLTGFIK